MQGMTNSSVLIPRGVTARLVLVVAFSGWAACSIRTSTVAPMPPSTERTSVQAAHAESSEDAVVEPPERSEPGACRAGGAPWAGLREGCLYEVAGCCYGTPEDACAAAACEAQVCQVIETVPAQIVCRAPRERPVAALARRW